MAIVRRLCSSRLFKTAQTRRRRGGPQVRLAGQSAAHELLRGTARLTSTELVVQDHGQESAVDRDVAVVIDEAEIAELIHEEVDA